eukprot:gene6056-4356_t
MAQSGPVPARVPKAGASHYPLSSMFLRFLCMLPVYFRRGHKVHQLLYAH